MKLKEVVTVEFNEAFAKFMALKGVNGSAMFKMKGIAKKLKAEVEKYNEARTEIINEVAEKDADGKLVMVNDKQVKIADDKVDEAQKRLKDLEEVEIELSEVKFSELGEKVELSASDLFHLEFIKE